MTMCAPPLTILDFRFQREGTSQVTICLSLSTINHSAVAGTTRKLDRSGENGGPSGPRVRQPLTSFDMPIFLGAASMLSFWWIGSAGTSGMWRRCRFTACPINGGAYECNGYRSIGYNS